MDELEIIQHKKIPGLTFFVNTVDHRTPHMHPEWEILCVLDQPLSIACGAEQQTLHPGQMVLFAPNEPHEFHKIETDCTFLCMQISPAELPIPQQMTVLERCPHSLLPEGELAKIRQMLLQAAKDYLRGEPFYELSCMGTGALILHKLLKNLPTRSLTPEEAAIQEKRNARIKRLIRFVEENYMHKIRLADFAEQEDCSLSYLSHFIKETTNQTFQEYVNTVRFNAACKLIAAGGRRMLDVCMEAGFSDYRYFTRAFRQHLGMTPEEFSRQNGQHQLDRGRLHHSIHSRERFYGAEDSLRILEAAEIGLHIAQRSPGENSENADFLETAK